MAYLTDPSQVPTKGRGSKLSRKMRNFVDEYMTDFVGSHAVVRAGYKTTNPDQMAAQLLAHPLVKAEIEARRAVKLEKQELKAEYVIQKLIRIVEDTETGNPQAALRGLELLGKHLGMYKERQEISGPDGGAIETMQRTKEDIADFKSKLDRLAESGGKGGVTKFPEPGSSS